MKMIFLLCCVCWVTMGWALPVEPVIVTEQTLKINGEQRFFYAFEEGDQILLDLSMVKGKFLKELEVLVYKGGSRFQDRQVEKLSGKTIKVPKRAVYEFRLKSGGAKVVRFKLKRIPYYESRSDFDTHVRWKTVKDTIRRNYKEQTKVVYDTTWVTKYRRVLHRIDTGFVEVVNQQERVHSRTNLSNSNINTLRFNLPPNVEKKLYEQEVLAWAYWIVVGQEGMENYDQELKKFLRMAASKIITKNLLAGIALGVYSVVYNPPKGENIHYTLTNSHNGKKSTVSNGNITSTFGRETNYLQGHIDLKLTNDNIMNGLNVNLQLLAVVEKRHYVMEGHQERVITPLEVKKTKGKVLIREREVPVIYNW